MPAKLLCCSKPFTSTTFRTEVFVEEMPMEIQLDDSVFLMGSCFSENIGSRLQTLKFQVEVNPFGISYNPLSLAWNLERLLIKSPFSPEDLACGRDGRFFSYKHHSSFTSNDRDRTLSAINAAHIRGGDFLSQTKILFLTLGSAFAYRLKESGMLVANCHKQPASLFDKFMATPTEIEDALLTAVHKCREVNPDIKVVLTVSPVRHWYADTRAQVLCCCANRRCMHLCARQLPLMRCARSPGGKVPLKMHGAKPCCL
jgi:hypothetical protein